MKSEEEIRQIRDGKVKEQEKRAKAGKFYSMKLFDDISLLNLILEEETDATGSLEVNNENK